MSEFCPRCGAEYSWVERRKVGDHIYLYAVHVVGRGKNRRFRKCYLGPEGGYEYVTRLHEREGLVLMGLVASDRAVSYLQDILDHIVNDCSLDQEDIDAVISMLEDALRMLKNRRCGAEQATQ